MILISPYSKKKPNGGENPKNYPRWQELLQKLKENGFKTVQVGLKGDRLIGCDEIKLGLPLKEVGSLIDQCDFWISIDNFFPHFAKHHNKRGIVIWGKSDPLIFGYPENINLLKDRKYLRGCQWLFWHDEEYDADVFVDADTVFKSVLELAKKD